MNNSFIANALSELQRPIFASVYDSKRENDGIPFFENKGLGYFVVGDSNENGEIHGDSHEDVLATSFNLHYFTPENTIKKITKRALRKAGFCIGAIQTLYENDTGLEHIIYQLSYLSVENETETEEIII